MYACAVEVSNLSTAYSANYAMHRLQLAARLNVSTAEHEMRIFGIDFGFTLAGQWKR
jgi:hypothetical protein